MPVQTPTAEPHASPSTPSAGSPDAQTSAARSFATRSPAAQPKQRKLSPRIRKWIVAAHVLIGVGWFGINNIATTGMSVRLDSCCHNASVGSSAA